LNKPREQHPPPSIPHSDHFSQFITIQQRSSVRRESSIQRTSKVHSLAFRFHTSTPQDFCMEVFDPQIETHIVDGSDNQYSYLDIAMDYHNPTACLDTEHLDIHRMGREVTHPTR
jgi:hypothetical protein